MREVYGEMKSDDVFVVAVSYIDTFAVTLCRVESYYDGIRIAKWFANNCKLSVRDAKCLSIAGGDLSRYVADCMRVMS